MAGLLHDFGSLFLGLEQRLDSLRLLSGLPGVCEVIGRKLMSVRDNIPFKDESKIETPLGRVSDTIITAKCRIFLDSFIHLHPKYWAQGLKLEHQASV